ncbi:MAG: ADP-ribosylglycohydrolase family protein [Candidatus Neomarinimicrobiota bacterium]
MATESINNRTYAALMGFAVGEALSWTSLYAQECAMPEWLGRIRRDMEKQKDIFKITSNPIPFALNQATKPLFPAPADLTEWAVWTADLLVKNDGTLDRSALHSAWRELANRPGEVSGRISIQTAIRNLNKGLTEPQCGRFNPHYFDDGALPRAVVIGAVHPGDWQKAGEIAARDAAFTQYEDGIYSARALAVAVSLACGGYPVPEIISTVLVELPENSLTKQTVMEALDMIRDCDDDIFQAIFMIARNLTRWEYSYANIAHEILAAALALISITGGDFQKTISAAALIPRSGAALMAVSAALSAAISEYNFHKKKWIDIFPEGLSGRYVPSVKNIKVTDIAEQLAILAAKNLNARGKNN